MEFHYIVHYLRKGKSLNNFFSLVISSCRLYTETFVVTPLFSHTVNFPLFCIKFSDISANSEMEFH